MPKENVLMLTYPGWDSPQGRTGVHDPGELDLPPDWIMESLMAGRPIVITLPPDPLADVDIDASAIEEDDAEDLEERERARAEAKRIADDLRRQQALLRQQQKLLAAQAAAQASLERQQQQRAQQATVRAQRDQVRNANAAAAQQDLFRHYNAMVASIGDRQAVQTAFNARLTNVHTAITSAPLASGTESDVLQLKRDVAIAVISYDRAMSVWKPALRITKQRIGFLTTARDKQTQLEALAALKVLIRQDPRDTGVASTEFDTRTLRRRLKELNDTVTRLVRLEEKTRRKQEIFKQLRDAFVAEMGMRKLPDRKYSDLSDREKALIRNVRQGLGGARPVITPQYYWERKAHEYRSDNAPKLTGSGLKYEYRLHTTGGSGTTSVVNGTTYHLTGERMTSIGAPNSDRMLFFHISHPNGAEYQYGLVTRLPLRRDKNQAKETPEPEGFPAAPADVVLV